MALSLPTGMYYETSFLTASEQQSLIHHVKELPWQHVALFGQIAKRRVVHFGMDYHYGRRQVVSSEPAPEFMHPLIARAAQLVQRTPKDIAEILISEYPANAGIGWHRDAPVFELIIGISLNSATPIQFRKRADHKEKIKLILEPGSIYTLAEAVRWDWEHRIAPVKQLRYSITFRTLRPQASLS